MGLKRIYEIVIEEWGDPRAEPFFLINTPFPLITVLVCYAYFVCVWGPNFMKNRPPFNLDKIVTVYNCIQVLWNIVLFYMCTQLLRLGIADNYDWWCIPMQHKNKQLENLFTYGGAWYFYNKLFDLLDTVFFVLRKKSSQVTYLHMFHHSVMAVGGWIYVKYHLSGNGYSLIVSNVLVHVVMYTYYQFSLMKWNTLRWKKHLTQMQIVQFSIIIIHHGNLFFRNPCKNYLSIALLVVSQAVYMTSLFVTFYINEYIIGKNNRVKKETSEMETNHMNGNTHKLQNGLHQRTSTKPRSRVC